MKEGLVTISSFLRSINLEMSVIKTKYILFETKNSSRDGYFSEIPFAGGVVQRVNNFKYLGLLIDSKLLWEDHVDKTLKEIAPFVGILRKIRSTTHIFIRVFITAFQSGLHAQLIEKCVFRDSKTKRLSLCNLSHTSHPLVNSTTIKLFHSCSYVPTKAYYSFTRLSLVEFGVISFQ
jgi:hypothetical protein